MPSNRRLHRHRLPLRMACQFRLNRQRRQSPPPQQKVRRTAGIMSSPLSMAVEILLRLRNRISLATPLYQYLKLKREQLLPSGYPQKRIKIVSRREKPSYWDCQAFVPAAGGVPIIVGGKVIGAIGVSGATPSQDHQSAEAGVAAVK